MPQSLMRTARTVSTPAVKNTASEHEANTTENRLTMSVARMSGNGQSLFFGFQRDLPVRGRAQGGTDGNMTIEENPIDWTFRPADLQGVHNAFAVFVTGDSMEPKYRNRDIAYIHPTQRPQRGRYVLVETKSRGGFIKRFEGWQKDCLKLSQHNPARDLLFERSEVLNVMLVIGSLDA